MDISISPQSMHGMHFTQHAEVRMQQRGIPAWYLRLLVEHGKTTHDGHGAQLKSMNKATRQRLRRRAHQQSTPRLSGTLVCMRSCRRMRR